MNKHTPGPWEIFGEDISSPGVPCIVIEVGQKRIAEVCSSFNEDTEDLELTAEDSANAALIAAAPDMLGALEIVLESMQSLFQCTADPQLKESLRVITEEIGKTVKKARGES